MAILKDWKIVSNKLANKKEKVKVDKFSLKWKEIWFIDKTTPFSSYEWVILDDEPSFWLIKVKVISKDINNPFDWIKNVPITQIRYA
jgi:hypothetical protein